MKTMNRYDYSMFRDAHPRTGKMGWAAQVLEMPDEFMLKYTWHETKPAAVGSLAAMKARWGQEQLEHPKPYVPKPEQPEDSA